MLTISLVKQQTATLCYAFLVQVRSTAKYRPDPASYLPASPMPHFDHKQLKRITSQSKCQNLLISVTPATYVLVPLLHSIRSALSNLSSIFSNATQSVSPFRRDLINFSHSHQSPANRCVKRAIFHQRMQPTEHRRNGYCNGSSTV